MSGREFIYDVVIDDHTQAELYLDPKTQHFVFEPSSSEGAGVEREAEPKPRRSKAKVAQVVLPRSVPLKAITDVTRESEPRLSDRYLKIGVVLVILFFAMVLLSITGSSPEPGGWVLDTGVPVEENTTYTFSVHIRGDVGNEEVKLFYKVGDTFKPVGDKIVLSNDWERYTLRYDPAPSQSGEVIKVGVTSTGNAVTTFYCTGLQLEKGTLSDWFPGTANGTAGTGADSGAIPNLLSEYQSSFEGAGGDLESFSEATGGEALLVDNGTLWRGHPSLKCVSATQMLFEEVVWLGLGIPVVFIVGVVLCTVYYAIRKRSVLLEIDGGEEHIKISSHPEALKLIERYSHAYGSIIPDAEIDAKLDAATLESGRGVRGKTINVCPQCGSADLSYEGGLVTGYKYACKSCRYVGTFVVERDLEAFEAMETGVESEDISVFPEYIQRIKPGVAVSDLEGVGFVPCENCSMPVEVPEEPAQYPLRTRCAACRQPVVLGKAPEGLLLANALGRLPRERLGQALHCPRCEALITLRGQTFPQTLHCQSCGARTLVEKMPKTVEVVELDRYEHGH